MSSDPWDGMCSHCGSELMSELGLDKPKNYCFQCDRIIEVKDDE